MSGRPTPTRSVAVKGGRQTAEPLGLGACHAAWAGTGTGSLGAAAPGALVVTTELWECGIGHFFTPGECGGGDVSGAQAQANGIYHVTGQARFVADGAATYARLWIAVNGSVAVPDLDGPFPFVDVGADNRAFAEVSHDLHLEVDDRVSLWGETVGDDSGYVARLQLHVVHCDCVPISVPES